MPLTTAAEQQQATTFQAHGTAPKNTDSFRRFSRKVYSESPHKEPGVSIQFNEETRRIIREVISYYGIAWLEAKTTLHEQSIYKMLAGYGEQCRPSTQKKLKKFLAGYVR